MSIHGHQWYVVGEAIDQNIQINTMKDISLSVMNERFPFVTHLSKIQEISDTAARELLIEIELQKMLEQWFHLPILVEPIRSSNVRTPSEAEDICSVMEAFVSRE